METKLVNYKMPIDLIEQIEEMSSGNKTALVIDLLKQAISMRKVNDDVRLSMYLGAKQSHEFNNADNKQVRNIIDGLWV